MDDRFTDEDWGRIAAYLDGELAPAERDEFEHRITNDPELNAILDGVRKGWGIRNHRRAEADARSIWGADTAFAEFVKRRDASRTQERTIRVAVRPRWMPENPIARGAAAMGAVVAAIMLALGVRFASDLSQSSASRNDLGRTYVVNPGHRERVQLPDGSVVVLAPGTTMHLAAGFGTARRVVTLDGEAYFDIEHTSHLPFLITTGTTTTRVLGTRFNVRAYQSDGTVNVTVIDGKVAVDDTIVLAGGESVSRDPIGVVTRRTDLSPAQVSAWTNGELIFQDTPLLEVIPQIERWYDLRIHLANAQLASLPLRATFRDTDSADVVLTVLSKSLGITVQRRDRDVSFQ
jgi:ferric-dicitrate binding protein FerR (iron transport regulator)